MSHGLALSRIFQLLILTFYRFPERPDGWIGRPLNDLPNPKSPGEVVLEGMWMVMRAGRQPNFAGPHLPGALHGPGQERAAKSSADQLWKQAKGVDLDISFGMFFQLKVPGWRATYICDPGFQSISIRIIVPLVLAPSRSSAPTILVADEGMQELVLLLDAMHTPMRFSRIASY